MSGAVVSHLNITKRKLAEEKNALFRALVDQALPQPPLLFTAQE